MQRGRGAAVKQRSGIDHLQISNDVHRPVPQNTFGPTQVTGDNSTVIQGDIYGTLNVYDTSSKTLERFLATLSPELVLWRTGDIAETKYDTFEWIFDDDMGEKYRRLQSLRHKGERSRTESRNTTADTSRSFSRWLSDAEDHEPYLIIGKPGSGKSTLMKMLNSHEQVEQHFESTPFQGQCVILFHSFWAVSSQKLQHNFEGMMKSLLYQLLSDPSMDVNGLKLEGKLDCCRRVLLEHRHLNHLKHLLRSILDRHSSITLILLDGLDEFLDQSGDDQLFDFLSELSDLNNVKVCLSSRPEPHILQRYNRPPDLRLETMTWEDIHTVVSKTLKAKCKGKLKSMAQEIDELAETITSKAEGVFLWAHYVLQNVCKGLLSFDVLKDLHRRIDQLPPDMIGVYRFMLAKHEREHGIHSEMTKSLLSYCNSLPMSMFELMLLTMPKLLEHYRSILEPYDREELSRLSQSFALQLPITSAGLFELFDLEFDGTSGQDVREELSEPISSDDEYTKALSQMNVRGYVDTHSLSNLDDHGTTKETASNPVYRDATTDDRDAGEPNSGQTSSSIHLDHRITKSSSLESIHVCISTSSGYSEVSVPLRSLGVRCIHKTVLDFMILPETQSMGQRMSSPLLFNHNDYGMIWLACIIEGDELLPSSGPDLPLKYLSSLMRTLEHEDPITLRRLADIMPHLLLRDACRLSSRVERLQSTKAQSRLANIYLTLTDRLNNFEALLAATTVSTTLLSYLNLSPRSRSNYYMDYLAVCAIHSCMYTPEYEDEQRYWHDLGDVAHLILHTRPKSAYSATKITHDLDERVYGYNRPMSPLCSRTLFGHLVAFVLQKWLRGELSAKDYAPLEALWQTSDFTDASSCVSVCVEVFYPDIDRTLAWQTPSDGTSIYIDFYARDILRWIISICMELQKPGHCLCANLSLRRLPRHSVTGLVFERIKVASGERKYFRPIETSWGSILDNIHPGPQFHLGCRLGICEEIALEPTCRCPKGSVSWHESWLDDLELRSCMYTDSGSKTWSQHPALLNATYVDADPGISDLEWGLTRMNRRHVSANLLPIDPYEEVLPNEWKEKSIYRKLFAELHAAGEKSDLA